MSNDKRTRRANEEVPQRQPSPFGCHVVSLVLVGLAASGALEGRASLCENRTVVSSDGSLD